MCFSGCCSFHPQPTLGTECLIVQWHQKRLFRRVRHSLDTKTGAPQGCVLSLLLYHPLPKRLYHPLTHHCAPQILPWHWHPRLLNTSRTIAFSVPECWQNKEVVIYTSYMHRPSPLPSTPHLHRVDQQTSRTGELFPRLTADNELSLFLSLSASLCLSLDSPSHVFTLLCKLIWITHGLQDHPLPYAKHRRNAND